MENSGREVRRVFSRFSRHNATNYKSGSGLSDGGGKARSEEQKKPMKRLSAAQDKDSRRSEENGGRIMGADGRRKIKPPNKIFGDRNPVDHSSVPRKLRSAMTKGVCKSASQPSFDQKRLYSSVGSPVPIKRSKKDMQNAISDRLTRRAFSGPITKEEEDVAEILYGLAGLGPGNGSSLKSKLDVECSIKKSVEPPSNELQDSPPVSEVLRKDSEVNVSPTSMKATNQSLAVGLSPVEGCCVASPASGVDGQATSSFPSWLRTAVSSNKYESCECLNSGRKVAAIPSSNARSLKRCATHVNIAFAIQELQVSKLNDIRHLEDSQPCSSVDLSKGALHKKPDHVGSRERKGLNAVMFPCNIVGSTDPRNHKEAGSCPLMCESPQQTTKQAPDPPEPATMKHQGFDFLSISRRSGDPVAKADDVFRDRLQPPTQAHVPYMPPLPRCGPVISFMLPENHPSSKSYRDQNSTASTPSLPQVNEVPAYLRSQVGALHIGLATSATQLQLQQRQFWAANQAAAQYGPGTLTATKILQWQNTGHGQHSSMQFMQTFLTSPHLNGATGPNRLLHISRQEQQLTALASTSPAMKSKTTNSQLSSFYEEKGGRLPLQLLCNERL